MVKFAVKHSDLVSFLKVSQCGKDRLPSGSAGERSLFDSIFLMLDGESVVTKSIDSVVRTVIQRSTMPVKVLEEGDDIIPILYVKQFIEDIKSLGGDTTIEYNKPKFILASENGSLDGELPGDDDAIEATLNGIEIIDMFTYTDEGPVLISGDDVKKIYNTKFEDIDGASLSSAVKVALSRIQSPMIKIDVTKSGINIKSSNKSTKRNMEYVIKAKESVVSEEVTLLAPGLLQVLENIPANSKCTIYVSGQRQDGKYGMWIRVKASGTHDFILMCSKEE